MKQCYVVRNADEDDEFVCAIVAKSTSDAKKRGMSLLDCEYINVRTKKHKNVDVSYLPEGEIADYFWALSQGLYGWIEDNCPRCESDSRIYYDNGFFCSACEDERYKSKDDSKEGST